MALLLWATRLGIGVTPDSIAYIGAARSLAAGQGLTLPTAAGSTIPFTHHAPFYAFLLGVLSAAGPDPTLIARWLTLLLAGFNLILLGWMVAKIAPQKTWLPLVGVGLALAAPPFLENHAFALTEPLFLFLGFTALICLANYLAAPLSPANGRHYRYLVLAGGLIALAGLTRYIGLALIVVGGIGVLLFSAAPMRRRILNGGLFTFIAFLPLLLWFARNQAAAGSEATRAFAFHPVGRAHFQQMIDAFSSWLFIPLSLPGWLKGIILLALIGGVLLVIIRRDGPRRPALLKLLLLFVPVYLVLLLLSISFFDANTPLDQRILSPVYMAGLVIFLFAGHSLWTQTQPQRFVRPLLLGGVVFFFAAHILQAAPWLMRASQEGLGFHHIAWQRSSLMAEVKTLPDEVVLYANTPDAVYFLTGRLAHSLPRK